jgi:hypothetical protein
MLVSSLAYSSTLKMEVICFSETPVDFQQLHGIICQKRARGTSGRIWIEKITERTRERGLSEEDAENFETCHLFPKTP